MADLVLPRIIRVATGNAHKVEELRAILTGWPLDVLRGADPYPPESEPTYFGNARIKARHVRTVAEPDAWVIAEDSGIEVSGLFGEPGDAWKAAFSHRALGTQALLAAAVAAGLAAGADVEPSDGFGTKGI
jgi:inosine/xanthosine triphosphate pyrophosphatase family protein